MSNVCSSCLVKDVALIDYEYGTELLTICQWCLDNVYPLGGE